MNTSLKLTAAIISMTAAGGLWLVPAAYAASVKECPTTPPSTEAHFTQGSHASCNSSGTEETTTGPKKNSQGHDVGVP